MARSEVMLVTGGSGGIGAETARLAAERGYAVALAYFENSARADAVVASLRTSGARAVGVQADVRREADVERLFETAARELGPITALVNAAGLAQGQARLVDMDAARIERVFATNVVGTLLCSREAVRRMSPRRGGTGGAIVNVSSAAARLGSPGEYVDYAAAKGAVDTFTLGLAREVASEKIRVNAVRPGIIDTEFHARAGDPERAERLGSTLPLGRAGTAREVAQAILWLASEAASYCTGALLDVAGGR
jgi:NAD(P)-dependent dehydrogenase (short-subunit alcohol dehydrogenase family)